MVVGHKDNVTYHRDARRGLHHDIDLAEKEVEVRPYLRRIFVLAEREFCAVRAEFEVGRVWKSPPCGERGSLGEVDKVVLWSAWVWRAYVGATCQ